MGKQLRLAGVPPAYCIDASALIDLGRWYPQNMKVFEPIWEKIESLVIKQRLVSPMEVKKEISMGTDNIVNWCKKHKKMFKDVDICQAQEMHNVQDKYDPEYWYTETNKPGYWADPWVIALSICEDTVIVTNENKTKPNRIPAIARNFDIKTIDLLEFFKEIGIE